MSVALGIGGDPAASPPPSSHQQFHVFHVLSTGHGCVSLAAFHHGWLYYCHYCHNEHTRFLFGCMVWTMGIDPRIAPCLERRQSFVSFQYSYSIRQGRNIRLAQSTTTSTTT
eukprot:scaffold554172_cov153-Attheya_sp.AAC.1